jgi:anti-sigma regulatory factor (Ser/Thr protein kinase)
VAHELVLPPHPASVGTARRYVAQQLVSLGVADPDAGAELVVSELVTNAVMHARTDIVLRVVSTEDGTRIDVADESAAVPGLRLARADASRGHGLTLVEHFAHRWGVERTPTGKIVWFLVRQEA